MGELAIGQYYPSNSVLHKLDPRVKFIWTIIYIVSLFVVRGVAGYAIAMVTLLVLFRVSKIPLHFIFKSMKPVWFILVVTAIFNLLLTQGTIVVEWGIFHITEEGIRLTVRMAVRLVFLVIGASLMTLTTTPTALTDAMENLFSFLGIFHVPVHEIAMMMSIALRFIPILTEETDKIKKAQIARGADFESGNFIQRIKAMIPLLVPLFVSAFRRANDLAMAMEARCYHGGDDRTRMKPLKYESRDKVAYLLMVLYLAACIASRVLYGTLIPM